MTAADRPSVTDDARAEAERRWGDRRTSDRLPSDWLDEGMASGFVLGAQWAAGRAETTTATVEDAVDELRAWAVIGDGITPADDDEEWIDRTILSSAIIDGRTERIEGRPETIVQRLADAGLLATARTRPTRTIYSVQHWEDADGIRASWVTGYGQYTHSREDAEATLRHQERQHPDMTFRLAQAEVTAWTETGQ